jgi:AcrR family transcriptional regulator
VDTYFLCWRAHSRPEGEMNRPNILRGEELQPPPKQSRSRRRRDAILEAAIVRFSRDGFEHASIEGIAQAAGVATGAVYQFFRSKRQLLLVLMDTLLRRLNELNPPSFTQGKTILDGIEQFLTQVFARELEFVGVYRA